MMYFDEIMIFEEEPEMSGVSIYCGACKEFMPLELENFTELSDKEYVILKDGITLKCDKCGKVHEGNRINFKLKDHYAPSLPRCPICQSYNLKKISTGSKLLAAGTVGVFALPYTSKTFECKDCGYKF